MFRQPSSINAVSDDILLWSEIDQQAFQHMLQNMIFNLSFNEVEEGLVNYYNFSTNEGANDSSVDESHHECENRCSKSSERF